MTLEAEGITVRYRDAERPALEDVSLTIPDGRLTAVLGPNGSGKSTLLRALLGAVPLRAGRVTIEGRDVGAWDRRALARAVGVVPQSEATSFPITVREMVGMGRYPHLGPLQAEGEVDREAVRRAPAPDAADIPAGPIPETATPPPGATAPVAGVSLVSPTPSPAEATAPAGPAAP